MAHRDILDERDYTNGYALDDYGNDDPSSNYDPLRHWDDVAAQIALDRELDRQYEQHLDDWYRSEGY